MILNEEIIEDISLSFRTLFNTKDVEVSFRIKNDMQFIYGGGGSHYHIPAGSHGPEITMIVLVKNPVSRYTQTDYPAHAILNISRYTFAEEVFRDSCVITNIMTNMDDASNSFKTKLDFIVVDLEKFASNLSLYNRSLYEKQFTQELERTLKD